MKKKIQIKFTESGRVYDATELKDLTMSEAMKLKEDGFIEIMLVNGD